MSFSDFLHMSGYGVYIWPCFALTAVVMVGLDWASRRRLEAAQSQAMRRTQNSRGNA
jgi:heme exporter protein CcmD